jgi:hypothetical protein
VRHHFADGPELLHTTHALRAREELDPLVAKHRLPVSQLLEPNPTEQGWLQAMHPWRESGWSYHQIAKELNRLNIPTKTGAGNVIPFRGARRLSCGRWHCGNVRKVLLSRMTQDWLRQQFPA